MTVATSRIETSLRGLHASPSTPLPFAPSLHVRSFLLERDHGNVLIYGAPGVQANTFAGIGPIARAYLNHRHEAAFGDDIAGVPLFVHKDDGEAVARKRKVRATFSQRHTLDDDLEVIPTPGHTPGATAYLWDNGEHRFLFTGDSVFLRDGEWIAAVLDSSDRAAYLESLALIRGLDYDVLVPWAVTDAPYALTTRDDAQARLDAIIARVRAGADH